MEIRKIALKLELYITIYKASACIRQFLARTTKQNKKYRYRTRLSSKVNESAPLNSEKEDDSDEKLELFDFFDFF